METKVVKKIETASLKASLTARSDHAGKTRRLNTYDFHTNIYGRRGMDDKCVFKKICCVHGTGNKVTGKRNMYDGQTSWEV